MVLILSGTAPIKVFPTTAGPPMSSFAPRKKRYFRGAKGDYSGPILGEPGRIVDADQFPSRLAVTTGRPSREIIPRRGPECQS
jgi:hypothetical protein